MRRNGFTILEVLLAAVVVATVMLGMAMFQGATLKVNAKEKDRAFATQKAVQIMEEILAYQVTAGTAGSDNVDSLAQGDNDYSFKLTIDPKVTDVTSPLSGNRRDRSGYHFVRQIRVEPMPNEKGARRVAVAVFLSDGGATANANGTQPLAIVSNVVKAAAVKTQPTQLYDLYLIDIENVPGWWTDPNTLREILASTIDFLKANNPGLEIRTHWIRRLAYGRDPYYTPVSNRTSPADNVGAVPFNWVYFYPGKLSSTTMKYNPDVLKGQMSVDGLVQNGYTDYGATVANFPERQTAYSYADEFNHAVRYPEEEAKYDLAVQQANHKNLPEMSLRMLIEKMNKGELRNAIMVNLHAELIPVPPMRNYSDAAKVPRSADDPSLIDSHWGVDTSGLSGAELDEGSHARLVTHPRNLEVGSNSMTELRVYPYKSKNLSTEPPDAYRKATVVVRELKSVLNKLNGGNNGDLDDIVIDVMHRDLNGGNGGSGYPNGSYDWTNIWPPTNTNRSIRQLYLDGNGGNSNGAVEFINNTDGNKDLRKNDLMIHFMKVPYTHLQAQQDSNYVDGLNPNVQLYGMNYFPDPALEDLDIRGNPVNGVWSNWRPRNTARFRISFRTDSRRLEVVTVIGSDTNLAHHQYPNRSTTYEWVGTPAPETETYQIVGDPRLNPYADTRNNHRYNRYFDNFSSGGAYRNAVSSDDWRIFSQSGTYVSQNIDLPRYFQLFREGLMSSNSIYLNPAGWSFYYYGLGGEVYSSVSRIPYGGTGLAMMDDIIGTGSASCYGITTATNAWSAVPALGELYPDDQWTTWKTKGNLPAPTYQRKLLSDMAPWLKGDGANPDFNKRMIADGARSFFNGGDAPATVFSHVGRTDDCVLTANGQSVANNFKMYLDSSYPSLRPFMIDSTDTPPDWAKQSAYRTSLSWGLLTGSLGYYEQSTSSTEIAVAPIAIRRTGRAGYAVMSAAAPSDTSGTTTLARLSLAAGLQSFFDLAAPTYRDGTSKGNNAIKLLPRINITDPPEDSQLAGNNVQLKWNVDWKRWDLSEYSLQHNNYGANGYRPAIAYNLKYSVDNGTTWKFLDDRTVTAYMGEYSPSHRITGTSYNWDFRNWQNKEYLVRLEAYRDIDDYRDTHYAFHQVAFQIAH